jgi:septal ring factor EnvC (AmiA/AmiB activator)
MNAAVKTKTEPQVDAPAASPVLTPSLGPDTAKPVIASVPAASAASGGDQLARIEDKLSRVEEKFARSEDRMQRLENALEKATGRLEGASSEMNLQGVKDDITAMRRQVSKKPGAASVFLITLATALVAAALGYAAARFGIPGLPR